MEKIGCTGIGRVRGKERQSRWIAGSLGRHVDKNLNSWRRHQFGEVDGVMKPKREDIPYSEQYCHIQLRSATGSF